MKSEQKSTKIWNNWIRIWNFHIKSTKIWNNCIRIWNFHIKSTKICENLRKSTKNWNNWIRKWKLNWPRVDDRWSKAFSVHLSRLEPWPDRRWPDSNQDRTWPTDWLQSNSIRNHLLYCSTGTQSLSWPDRWTGQQSKSFQYDNSIPFIQPVIKKKTD